MADAVILHSGKLRAELASHAVGSSQGFFLINIDQRRADTGEVYRQVRSGIARINESTERFCDFIANILRGGILCAWLVMSGLLGFIRWVTDCHTIFWRDHFPDS